MFKRKRAVPQAELTRDSLRGWLITELARRTAIAASEIDTAKSFESYGLDSRSAVQVSGALEKVVERRLSPGILFEHSTIDDLTDYLVGELRITV
ncbi:acyl carrier protein [Nocardia sp. NPDC050712]|uniref:acyl carrier protein n=1 Tax=Nocardia sp. NPDC050712 TaxID=3155518 RepID=UPI0033F046E6